MKSKKIIVTIATIFAALAADLFFGYTVLAADSSTVTILNQPVDTGSLNGFIQLAVVISNWILGITGSLALLAFVIGGFMFLVSGGSAQRIEQGKSFIKGAVIGLIIVFLSYTIIQFVLKSSGAIGDDNNLKSTGKSWFAAPQ